MINEPCTAQKKKFNFDKGKSLLKKVQAVSKTEETVVKPEETKDTSADTDEYAKKRKLDPPDVHEQIANARTAYAVQSYTETRFYVQQAIIGIELQIGNKILESMPDAVLGVSADKSEDVVFSTGAGFAGMNISREYPRDIGTNKAMVANNSALTMGMHMATTSPGMAPQDENTKITRYKGYKAVLEADDYRGYKMSIPIGQSSIFILDCRTCDSESQLIEAADLFDIDEFKSLLGEK